MTLFFWFDLFLEARAEILKKISLDFWSKQRHFEINLPLVVILDFSWDTIFLKFKSLTDSNDYLSKYELAYLSKYIHYSAFTRNAGAPFFLPYYP